MLATSSPDGVCPRLPTLALTFFLLMAGGEAGAAEAAGEGAHPCKGEHRGAQCEGEPVPSAQGEGQAVFQTFLQGDLAWGLSWVTCSVLPASSSCVLFMWSNSYFTSVSQEL